METVNKLAEGTQPQISVEELSMAEEIVKNDVRVLALVKELGEPLCNDTPLSSMAPIYVRQVWSQRMSLVMVGPLVMTTDSQRICAFSRRLCSRALEGMRIFMRILLCVLIRLVLVAATEIYFCRISSRSSTQTRGKSFT